MDPARRKTGRAIAGFVTVALIVGLAMMTSAMQGSAQDTEPNSTLRFVHASPDSPAVDVLVDGAPVAQNLEFGQATEFASIAPGDHTVAVVPAGSAADAELLSEDFSSGSGEVFTAVVAGLLNDLQIHVVQSNVDDLPDGESRLRVINVVPGVGDVDIAQVGGDVWFENASEGDATSHFDAAAGTYDLEVRQSDSDLILATASGLTVGTGNEYLLVVMGQQADESVQLLPLVVSVSTACDVVLGIGDNASNSCARIIHAAPDAPAVDIYIEDALVVEGLEFGSNTDFVAIPAGEGRSVKLVPAGGAIDENIVDSGVGFEAGRARDVVIGGSMDDLKVLNYDVNLAPLAPEQSRLRVIHLSPDAGNVDVYVSSDDDLFGDVGFEGITDEVVVNAGTYDVLLRAAGENEQLFNAEGVVIEAGQVYSMIVMGRVDAGTFGLQLASTPLEVREGSAVTVESGTPQAEASEGEAVTETTRTPLSEAQPADEEGTPTS